MRYSLMRDIMDGKLDEHLDLQLMVLESGVAETMGTLQAHFRQYREPGFANEHAGTVQRMFTGQALMRQLLSEKTLACTSCGEQEVSSSHAIAATGMQRVTLACGHHGIQQAFQPAWTGSGAV